MIWNSDVPWPRGWTWQDAGDGAGWNALRILCRGTRIQTWVNAAPAGDLDGRGVLDDESHRRRGVGMKGHTAPQLHTRDELYIQYRAIEIRPLP